MSESENGLPVLPYGWVWEARVSKESVTVMVKIESGSGIMLGKRTGECPSDNRKTHIIRLAHALWSDLNDAGRLSADLGIQVQYE